MKKNGIKLISLSAIMTMCFVMPISADENTKPVEIQQVFTDADGQWYPGRIQSNDFSIKNNRSKGIKVDRLSIKLTSSRNYKTGITLNKDSKEFQEISQNSIVTLKQGDKVLFEKNMSQLLEEEWTPLNEMISISSNSDAVLNMNIDMGKEEITNNAQAIESIFSIALTYKDDDNTTVKPEIDDEGDEDDNNDVVIKPDIDDGKLPQTGGIINSATLTLLGAVAIGTGIVIEKKSSSRKGGKDDE